MAKKEVGGRKQKTSFVATYGAFCGYKEVNNASFQTKGVRK